MIQPLLKDASLEADFATAPTDGSLSIWWLGQSGFLIKHHTNFLLIDPYLSNSLTRKYAGTDKPHVRMTEIPIAPERLAFVDAVLATHGHTDHLDPDTLGPLFEAGCKGPLLAPAAIRALAAERSGLSQARLYEMEEDLIVGLGPWMIESIPAAHETLERDKEGRHLYLGYRVTVGNEWSLYHSGDCVVYDGLAERLGQGGIDVALLPINGRNPERRVAGNMTGSEAAALAKKINARMVVPCHYEMFEFNTTPPDAFAAACWNNYQPFRVLRCGERLTLARKLNYSHLLED